MGKVASPLGWGASLFSSAFGPYRFETPLLKSSFDGLNGDFAGQGCIGLSGARITNDNVLTASAFKDRADAPAGETPETKFGLCMNVPFTVV